MRLPPLVSWKQRLQYSCHHSTIPLSIFFLQPSKGIQYSIRFCCERNLSFAYCTKYPLNQTPPILVPKPLKPQTTDSRFRDTIRLENMCQFQEQLWRCGCTNTLAKIPCHDLLRTKGKQCSGNRYRTDWIPCLCPGCEQAAAKNFAQGKEYQYRAELQNAAAVLELLKQAEKSRYPRKSNGFLDLYR